MHFDRLNEQNGCTYGWRSRIYRVAGGGFNVGLELIVWCGDAELPFSYTAALCMAMFSNDDSEVRLFNFLPTSAHIFTALISYATVRYHA